MISSDFPEKKQVFVQAADCAGGVKKRKKREEY